MIRKHILVSAVLVILLLPMGLGKADADELSGSGNDGYPTAMESYFRIDSDQVNALLKKNIPAEEVPVVLFMAQRTGLDPAAVAGVHASGLNWMQTAWHFRINPWFFYTPLDSKAVERTPYERAYGYYLSHSNKVNLTDPDIVNLVNLKFISEQYGCLPLNVVQMRSSGKTFQEISDYFMNGKEMPHWDVNLPTPETPSSLKKGEDSEKQDTGMPMGDRDGDGD
jgi:hypothetical protein